MNEAEVDGPPSSHGLSQSPGHVFMGERQADGQGESGRDMHHRTLKKIEAIARKAGYAFLATADGRGAPHIAVAGSLSVDAGGSISLEDWFCPGTVRNLDTNRQAVVVVWDGAADDGYQIGGLVDKIEEIAMMGGYSPNEEKLPPIPQVERRLRLRPERITQFRKAPHSDLED
jgi:hypothetical protein